MASGPVTAWQIEGEKVKVVTDFLFLGSKITEDVDCSHEIRRQLLLGRKAMTNLDRVLKSRDITLLTKVGIGLSSGQVQLWELDHKEDRMPDNWCLWVVVLEKTPESPLESKKIKLVNLKENQSWILVGRTDAEIETPVFWSSDAYSWLTGEVPDEGKDWGQQKRVSEDEMAGWHHWLIEHKLGQTSGDGEGQRPWHAVVHGITMSDMTGQLNSNNSLGDLKIIKEMEHWRWKIPSVMSILNRRSMLTGFVTTMSLIPHL